MDLSEARQRFVNYLKDLNRSPSTVIAYSKDADQLFSFFEGKKKISDINIITTKDLEDYIESIKSDSSYSLKTVSRKINSLKTLFKFLLIEGLVDNDPSNNIKHPKYKLMPPRVLSRLEYRALRDTVRNNPRLNVIVELLLQTGMRIGELARLKIQDVNISKKTVFVEKFASNNEREIPLNESAVAAVNLYLKIRPAVESNTENLFITKNGKPLLVRNIRTSINRAFRKAGIQDATVNDLRNTFIIEQLKNGLKVDKLAEIAGHKRLTSTKKYLEILEESPKNKTTKICEL